MPNLLSDKRGVYGDHTRIVIRCTLSVYRNINLMDISKINVTFSEDTGSIFFSEWA